MEMRIYFVNSDYTGLPFSAIFSVVTLSKDNVNGVSYIITEYRFGAASICEDRMLFLWGCICYDLEDSAVLERGIGPVFLVAYSSVLCE